MSQIGMMRRSRSIQFLIWFGFVIPGVMLFGGQCRAEGPKLADEDRKVLQQVGNFHEVGAATNLPPEILKLCVDFNGRLAGPGEKWDATDVIREEAKLPRRRLIWAVKGGDYYVVHYETGGRAHMYHVLVAVVSKDGTKPRIAMNASGSKKFKNYKEFVASLEL